MSIRVNSYTAPITEGKDLTFEQYAMRCARAFGYLISIRHHPMDEPIPEELNVSKYHSKQLEKIEKDYNNIMSLSDKECRIKAEEEYKEKIEGLNEALNTLFSAKERCTTILQQTEAWNPPHEHIDLKKFMIKMIEEALHFCSDTKFLKSQLVNTMLLTGQEWKAKEIRKIIDNKVYHLKEYTKEIEDVAKANAWLKLLRESLKKETKEKIVEM